MYVLNTSNHEVCRSSLGITCTSCSQTWNPHESISLLSDCRLAGFRSRLEQNTYQWHVLALSCWGHQGSVVRLRTQPLPRPREPSTHSLRPAPLSSQCGYAGWGVIRGGTLSLFSPRWLQERRPSSPSLRWPISIINMTLPLTQGRWRETENFHGLLRFSLVRHDVRRWKGAMKPYAWWGWGGRRGGRGQRQSQIKISLGLAQVQAWVNKVKAEYHLPLIQKVHIHIDLHNTVFLSIRSFTQKL
jgi:hypothetical protein